MPLAVTLIRETSNLSSMHYETTVVSKDVITINDTLDIFHTHINDYYSNYLFVFTNKGEAYKMVSNLAVYEWSFKDILESKP